MSRADILRPDSKGRITLGGLTKGVSSYHVTINKDNSILLEPYTEIPANERWIFDDKKVFGKIKKGLVESTDGDCIDLGSFAKYIDDSLEDV